MPRGLLSLLTNLAESAGSTLRIDDCRVTGTDHEFTCATELRPEQAVAVRQLATQDTAVLIAPPGSGKTVIACAAIALRRTSALVLVDRKALADQWRDRLHKHLGVKCGQIGGGRSKTTGIIDIALLPTLARRRNVDEITAGYGFVIVDECHHIAAATFSAVLDRIPARYWLGLTATPERRDGLEDLIYHQLGSHRHTMEPPAAGELPSAAADSPAAHPVLYIHPTRFRYAGDADPSAPGGMAEIYRALVADQDRLDQIVTDVLTAHRLGANILVLTTWVNHLDAINPPTLRCRMRTNRAARRNESARATANYPATRGSPTRTSTAAYRWDWLIHRRGFRLSRAGHPVPRLARHLQESSRSVRRPHHAATPRQDRRNRP